MTNQHQIKIKVAPTLISGLVENERTREFVATVVPVEIKYKHPTDADWVTERREVPIVNVAFSDAGPEAVRCIFEDLKTKLDLPISYEVFRSCGGFFPQQEEQ